MQLWTHSLLHVSLQVPSQHILQPPVQLPEHLPLHDIPQPDAVVSVAFATIGFDANITAPRIGNAPFAAFLKNSRLD